MIRPNLINNTTTPVFWEVTVTNGPTENTGVTVTMTIPSEFTIKNSFYLKGSLIGSIWTLPTLSVNEQQKIILELELTGTPASFTEEYTFVANVSGMDTLTSNNTLTDKLSYQVVAVNPLAGGNPVQTSSLSVDVSANDTVCSEGTTEWRLDTTSVTNAVVQSWDILTGQGNFTAIDPTKNITFTYDIFCVQGLTEYESSCDIPVEIYPQQVQHSSGGTASVTLKTETFGPLTTGNVITYTGSPVAGSDLIVLRNGQADNDFTHNTTLKTLTFATPFSIPTAAGSVGEFIDLTYITTI